MFGASDFTTGTPVTTMAGATVGPDRYRQQYPGDARYWVSDARWVQRAINAWRAAGSGRGALIVVDGQAGPITMTALRALGPGQPEPANHPSGRVTSQVRIAKAVADRLAALPVVADPRPVSRASTPTRPAGTPAGSEALAPVDAASSAPLRDEGSQNFWNEPWFMPAAVVGGMVLVAGGGLLWWGRTGRSVKANRRRGRRVRRNAKPADIGSSPTLAGIGQVIAKFYYGEKELRPAGENTWTVHKADGSPITSVIVRLQKGRYRFQKA